MATQIIPLDSVRKVQQHIRQVLSLPVSEDAPHQAGIRHSQDSVLPTTLGELVDLFQRPSLAEAGHRAPNAEGRWFVSSVNPGDALLQLRGLQVKTGWRLVPYLLRTLDGGVGHVCAVPEGGSNTSVLESALPEDTAWHYPPFPPGSLSHAMMALDGDHSAASYMIASILCREMQEFGAVGKDQQWRYHRIIATVPPQLQWRWKTDLPKNLAPKVNVMADGRAAVEFFSCRTQQPYAIFRHFDRYPSQSYLPELKDDAIAVASPQNS